MVGIDRSDPVMRPLGEISGVEKPFPKDLYLMAQSLAMGT
jgi:hypothetical protein